VINVIKKRKYLGEIQKEQVLIRVVESVKQKIKILIIIEAREWLICIYRPLVRRIVYLHKHKIKKNKESENES
jgi:hypothetical protein